MDELAGRAHDEVSETAAGTPAGAPEGVREAVVPLPTASPAFPGWDAAGDGRRSQKASLPDELRPRNRLFAAGAEALSSAELLAVLFSAFPGTGDAAAMELAGRLISERGDLHGLLRSTAHELVAVRGVGEAKASALLAAAELGKRMVSRRTPDRPVLSSPADGPRQRRGRRHRRPPRGHGVDRPKPGALHGLRLRGHRRGLRRRASGLLAGPRGGRPSRQARLGAGAKPGGAGGQTRAQTPGQQCASRLAEACGFRGR